MGREGEGQRGERRRGREAEGKRGMPERARKGDRCTLPGGGTANPTLRMKSASRPVSRVLYGAGCPARDGHSSGTIVADRLEQPTRATRAGNAPATVARRHRPYSVLLPVGFAVPRPLPAARCALTAPFHPYLRRRTPKAVCFLWHCPWGRPRRTLSGTVFPWSPDFPPPFQAAAVRPTGRRELGGMAGRVKEIRP